ncbi:cytochrome P450 9e2-like [Hylaeus anthracinus]|uniref:cytochrome P450 9e2-like n=1 Tax=Hylaeus anthracinus TaxID=313031 RepID=UPI0023B8E232|nr:cytochrome P450 9e2-like [Hylaeus anthracinus]
MDLVTAALFFVTVLLFVYQYVWKSMNYFKRMGIMHKSPLPILGNMAPIIFCRVCMSEYLQKLYNSFPNFKYFGFYMFTTPIIVVRDPDIVSSIAIKNFDNFTDHRGLVDEELDPLMGKNLFSLRGDHWREMRKLLSPSFTSSKMKTMFTLMKDCVERFAEHIAAESKNGKIYDLKDIFGRCSTDVIATTNFGIAVDSMKNKDNEFYVFVKKSMAITPIRSLKFLLGRNFPNLSKLLKIRVFSTKTRKYFTSIIDEAVRTRREKNVHRPDMIQLMMESRDTNGRQLSIDEMTNQAFVFFLGGFDTTSNLMCFAAHEIAANPDVQAKLRAEIENVMRKTNGKPTYDALKDMKYMDAVLDETNRLYPAAGFLDRVCVKEFELEPANPDSKPITMKPGDVVWFLPFATQRDPKIYPNPLKFDPDRFLNAEISQNTYMPFGIGPRICIGNRFALLENKIMLFYLLLRCEIEPCAKTTIPMRFSKKTAVLTADNGFWLNFKVRDNGVSVGDVDVSKT